MQESKIPDVKVEHIKSIRETNEFREKKNAKINSFNISQKYFFRHFSVNFTISNIFAVNFAQLFILLYKKRSNTIVSLQREE